MRFPRTGCGRARATALVAALSAALLSACAGSGGDGVPDADCDTFHFSAHRWKQMLDHQAGPAGRAMAAGIAQCGVLDGASRAQVRRRLGPQQDDDYVVASRTVWTYEVSMDEADSIGPAVDVVSLVVTFGRHGRVSDVRTTKTYRTI